MLDSIDRWENEGGRHASDATTASARSFAAPHGRSCPSPDAHVWLGAGARDAIARAAPPDSHRHNTDGPRPRPPSMLPNVDTQGDNCEPS